MDSRTFNGLALPVVVNWQMPIERFLQNASLPNDRFGWKADIQPVARRGPIGAHTNR